MTDASDKKLEFWNSRAALGEIAGTNDFPLKDLELRVILEHVRPGTTVLDVGCGNGETLLRLARERRCTGVGIDFSEEMLDKARNAHAAAGTQTSIRFERGELPRLPEDLGEFDYALSERCLINLDAEASQHAAFLEIMRHVKPGGHYLMIESCIQGLERTNRLRQLLDLEPIAPPWHNVFLDETAIPGWATDAYTLEAVIPFSSTYHFLSRVVYARLAKDKGEELRYDSDINMLACRLPVIGDFGPVRLWLWRRAER